VANDLTTYGMRRLHRTGWGPWAKAATRAKILSRHRPASSHASSLSQSPASGVSGIGGRVLKLNTTAQASKRGNRQKAKYAEPEYFRGHFAGRPVQRKTNRKDIVAREPSGTGTVLVHEDQSSALGVSKLAHSVLAQERLVSLIPWLTIKFGPRQNLPSLRQRRGADRRGATSLIGSRASRRLRYGSAAWTSWGCEDFDR